MIGLLSILDYLERRAVQECRPPESIFRVNSIARFGSLTDLELTSASSQKETLEIGLKPIFCPGRPAFHAPAG